MTDQVWGYKDGVNKFLEESGGGSSSFLVATATVTSSQLLNLTTVPAELVAAPGAGKMLVGLDFIIQVSAGTPYDDTGQQVEIALDPGDVDVTLVPNTDFAGFFGVVDRIWIPPTDYSFGIQPPADVVNKPIGMVNFGTELSGGDTELTVTTYYAELTVT